jgi:hypothetical protein
MNRDSRRLLHALLAGAFVSFLWPSAGLLAQDAAPAVDTASSASVESADQSRRDRRRAAKAETATEEERTQTAAAATEPTGDAGADDGVDESEVICKNIKPLGTRMAKRVCGTVAQWAALDRKTTDAASDDMRQIRGQSAVITTTPGPAVGPP